MLGQRKQRISGYEERRGKPRICVPFHATVEGKDNSGQAFCVETVLDNLSSSGLYLRILPRVEQGAKLLIELGLLTPPDMTDGATRFAIEGVVVRSDEKTGGVFGVAVNFENVRSR